MLTIAGAAILLGDLCLAWSGEMYESSALDPDRLSRGRAFYDLMRTEVMAGQYLDMLEQARGLGTVDSALRVMNFKAAKYTVERPLLLGAALAGGTPQIEALYTAYGDGWGFRPRTPEKLSLGLARITGGPTDFVGRNLRSPSAETKGDGAAGKKASGMLMVDGILYMWARNAGNAQLAWSADHARSWTWSEWKFAESFGAPTFLNFGKNYAGARDDYVYIYSFDSDSAYVPADRAAQGAEIEIEIRGKRARARQVLLPFYRRPKPPS